MDGEREDRHEALAAYVAGGLDDAERTELEAHLAECERCRAELRWLAPASDAVLASPPQVEPPASLRRNVLATVRAEARASEARGGPARWARSPRVRLAAAMACAAVLAAGLAGYFLARSEAPSTAPRATAELSGPGAAHGALISEGDRGTVEVRGMPPLRGGRVYEAWIRRDATLHPSTLFVVDRAGTGAAAIRHGLHGATAVMITREPRGGSAVPTSRPLLSASLG